MYERCSAATLNQKKVGSSQLRARSLCLGSIGAQQLGQVRIVSLLVAIGLNGEGYSEILGVYVVLVAFSHLCSPDRGRQPALAAPF
jgi:hypothetical protein